MKIAIPEKWKDVHLSEFREAMMTEDLNKQVAALSGLETKQLRKAPALLLTAAKKHVKFLLENEEPRYEPIIELEGTKYGIIPDWKRMTTGEWIDLENLLKDFWMNAPKIMSILYRPLTFQLGKKYDIEPYTTREDTEAFDKMPADIVSGALLFFCSTAMSAQTNTPPSSQTEEEQHQSSQKSGDGTTSWFSWLTSKFYKSKR
tara:strand:+ start:933 stop:1541 length:609 start_codon:yes stop_codon:yes gene_type:complete